MDLIFGIYTLVLGLLVGSFLNVCIFRIPREEEIVFTPSHCMACNARIRWYDLVPVFSYLALGGKCRNCGARLSPQYPLVEALNGAAYLFVFLWKGFQWETLVLWILFSTLLVVAVIDLGHYIIPDGIVLFLGTAAAIHTVARVLASQASLADHIIGFFAASGILLLMAVLSGGKMGGGDIKLMAVCGLLLGWQKIFLALMLGSVIGSVVGIALLATKVIRRNQMIPFGPFLSIGIFSSMAWGDRIIAWYLNSAY
ncbi:prepilin peptidase [Anaerotalea alkaliphila]|uniref:Prepilin leader peptidase/N-methyltransferase n=1 Tax=Anaerotalea alkaliphila TaxID=2662126 RepID=A0A7X5HT84_9FIRM|nr:A24 family peptidase [Anaerotalea alkaliphila]NDL66248.1 prepilin peptidase [Anaerotalea alkaliphila]